MTAEKRNVAIGVAGLVLGAITLGWAVYAEHIPLLVSQESEFIWLFRTLYADFAS